MHDEKQLCETILARYDLAGEERASKARELVLHMRRHGRLEARGAGSRATHRTRRQRACITGQIKCSMLD